MRTFTSVLTLLALTASFTYCQPNYPKFRTEVRGADTIVVAELTIAQSRALLQSKTQVRHQAELLLQKDSIITAQDLYIQFLDTQVADWDSLTNEYNKVLAFKETQVQTLEETIDIQSLQLKKQSRRKFIYLGSGLVTGFVVGVVVGALK